MKLSLNNDNNRTNYIIKRNQVVSIKTKTRKRPREVKLLLVAIVVAEVATEEEIEKVLTEVVPRM